MKASEILKLKNKSDVLSLLKENCNNLSFYDIDLLIDFYDNKHPILYDKEKDSYDIVQQEIDSDNNTNNVVHEVTPTKLCIPYAQQIITNMVAFLYGKDVDLILENDDAENDIELDKAFRKFKDIWTKDIRMMSILREATKRCGIETRSAIQFFWDDESDKIKAKVLSRSSGFDIYRHRDDYNKVDSVISEYKRNIIKDGKLYRDINTTDIWTKDGLIRYGNVDNDDKPTIKRNPMISSNKKLLFVYLEQENAEFQPVMDIINKQDYARSQHSDVNVRIGNPAMVVYGEIKKKPLYNSLVKIYEVSSGDSFDQNNNGGRMEYLELKSAPESIKLEMENNERDIYRFTYPDLSTLLSDSNFGNLSGKSIQLMFVQAFVKMAEKKVLHDDVLSRCISIIKALATDLYPEFGAMKDLKIGFNYNSILPSSDSDNVTMLAAAVSAGITSRENAVRILSFNTPDTLREIREEQLNVAIEKVKAETDFNAADIDASIGNDRNADGVNGN